MKRLLLLLLLCVACSKDDSQPKVYTSLEGKWKFTSKEVSGEFEIVNYFGKLTVDNGAGNFFLIGTKRFEIDSKQEVALELNNEFTMLLVNDKGGLVSFRRLDINKTYDQMTTSTYSYILAGTKELFFTDKIVITR